MSDLRRLSRRMSRLNKLLPKAASDNAMRLAVDITVGLVGATPADTTEAVSNWQVSVGTPIVDTISPYVPGMAGITKPESAARAVSEAKQGLARKKPKQPIWIVNNTDHIGELNKGTSTQAPAGFIESQVNFKREGFKFIWPRI